MTLWSAYFATVIPKAYQLPANRILPIQIGLTLVCVENYRALHGIVLSLHYTILSPWLETQESSSELSSDLAIARMEIMTTIVNSNPRETRILRVLSFTNI